ncbi:DUF2255 family protein [Christiangramia sp. SM2212]|uniref:DUF2255 family protein n=1 Tax=Christiangramia sediminicola TaxID=3073267 RepID=A0ABU1EL74_9FLAO|nr:DUF2255 family protein [Christiangramia sp. SM2212]MDR5589079.1 DUF2255 family protein [Christiangramia sp. SM2212]
MFPQDFFNYLQENTLIEVKAGRVRESFLPIWMVVVEKRIFARSWNKSDKSWFTEFQYSGVGQIKCGDKVIDIKTSKLNGSDPLNHKISQAYLEKYKQPENIKYAVGISKPEYFDYTMEFFY